MEERREEREEARSEYARSLANEALDIPEPEADVPAPPQILVYTLRIRGTEEQLKKLKQYMTTTGIAYEKIS